MKPRAKILIIAGSDSSGGAGIQADIKTVTALGCYAMTAVTAITAQNTTGVKSIVAIPPKEIANQILFTINDIKPEAVQLAAVKDNGYAIECIENPSEAVQLAAVKQNGNAIAYIKNSSEEVQLAAVNQNGRAIEDIDNPSSKVKAKADLSRWMKD